MAQPRAQKLETTNYRKIDNGNPNNSYSETTIGGSTVDYGMTEN